MKESSIVLPTTPFEDLILGSQFTPVLATKEGKTQTNVGIFQCRKCGATFLEEQEALVHYKYHVFETHKDYFSVVIGGLCPQSDCTLVQDKYSSIHFHCTYCSYAASEILDLPLHMEEDHLAFYKEVSLVLQGEDVQVNKVYKCGECDIELKGTVSIVHHLLEHEDKEPVMELIENGLSDHVSETKENGIVNNTSGETKENGVKEDQSNGSVLLSPMFLKALKETHEQIQIEINPLDLLSSLIEEDQKSAFPAFPTHHFLLGQHQEGASATEAAASSSQYLQNQDESNERPLTPVDDDQYPPTSCAVSVSVNGHLHEIFHSPAGVFQCNQCHEGFKYQYLLVAHRKQVHQGNILTPFKCHICNNEFALLVDLKQHMVGHSKDFTFFCQVCGHAFAKSSALKSHMVDHGKSPGKSLKEVRPISPIDKCCKCEGCNQEFLSKSELTRHIVQFQGTCNPNKADSLRCATCSEEMSSLDALKEHRRSAHPEGESQKLSKKGFQCDYCGKNFSCRSNLRDHLVVHTGEKPYPCEICGKAFSFIHNMKTHRLTHNQGRNELCPYCDKAYKSKISLYYHMKKGNCRGLSTKEVPEGFRRCTECLQMFASEERYQVHKAKGACQMSYRCIHCGLRCSTQDRLDKHLRKALCNKKISSSSLTDPTSALPMDQERRKQRRRRKARQKEEICCERCNNYNRDCCCTFSCNTCGKRVFSSSAFMSHQRMHNVPASSLLKKERIRAAILEKRRKKKRSKDALSLSNKKKILEDKEELICFKTSELRDFIVESKDASKLDFNTDPTSPTPVEDDDSNSLTDLSTFTAPNILKPTTQSLVLKEEA